MDLEQQIRARLDALTKPPGSLGKLEDIAVRMGLIQGSLMPEIRARRMIVFCADHGIVEEDVTAYPQEVTRQMLANFHRGGAAINVLCRNFQIEPEIVDLGVGNPTRNFAREPAMSRAEAMECIERGRALVNAGELIGAGEMGIGNSTSAAALFSAFSGLDPVETVGRGAGLDDAGVARKTEVVRRALALHKPDPRDAVGVLAAVGGREIGAIAGLLLAADERKTAIVLDGFISCAAAFIARVLNPACMRNVFFAHCSAERGHRRMLEFLGAEPLFDLGMRLGEGTGAAIGISLIEASVRLYREMATFEEAGVATSTPPAAIPSA
jgi:nicotinate-nucleotide--dimethylbenzimidazole phosphoribosyltransferase